jgi:Protein of unknown function (DUF3662)/FHA domain
MNLLKSVETTISNLVEGTFGRVFRSEVRPMELARKLAREMDSHRTVSVSRVYVPNEYSVWLSPKDRARYEGVEGEVIDELCAYLLEHARREDVILASQPHIAFHTDERLSLGEFGIQARLVRHDGEDEGSGSVGPPQQTDAPEQPQEHGNTMIYSTSARAEEARAQRQAERVLLAVGGRRLLVPAGGATIGRSRDCDVVLDDAGISRRHAEIRPGSDGWTVQDLGSTNGVLVNGEHVRGARSLRPGDRVGLGSTEIVFELA